MSGYSNQTSSKRVTLMDIAERTGYSRALVSIVMRDVPGASAETRRRVLAVANELGYRADIRARGLASQRSRMVGVVFGVAGTFHFDLLDGLYAAADQNDYGLVLSALTRGRDERRAMQPLQDFRFDGLIMLGPPTRTPLMAGALPLAVIGWHVEHEDVDVVRTSDEVGMQLAVSHLADLGHRRIAHIDGGTNLIATARRNGYLEAMRARGLAEYVRVVRGGETQLDGQHGAQALLADAIAPTAVVAYNDDVAVAAISVFTQHGIDVPGELSVIGWDDTVVAELARVKLTTVTQQPRLLAQLAFERVLQRLDGNEIRSREIVLEPTLTIRDSTAGRLASQIS